MNTLLFTFMENSLNFVPSAFHAHPKSIPLTQNPTHLLPPFLPSRTKHQKQPHQYKRNTQQLPRAERVTKDRLEATLARFEVFDVEAAAKYQHEKQARCIRY